MSVKLYVEGGGEGQLQDTLFRQGWTKFFEAAGLAGKMPSVVRGQGRTQTFDLFATAVMNPRSGKLPLLLVDSEDPVEEGHSVWQHLEARDGWRRPPGAADDQAFLMVQVMETWFLADRELLRRYFGNSLRENHIRQWPALEDVPKPTVFDALENATAACHKPYAKGKVSYELLGQLNPGQVEAACPHAKVLLERLRSM
ncbi:MAG TPA: DUF4276 family protein [Thermoanaerobaculia bacterium]|nr:DUF4276 family protein [Thermoanaerobaculia bacterium]